MIINGRFIAYEQGFFAMAKLHRREKCELSLTEINKISHILLAVKSHATYYYPTDTR